MAWDEYERRKSAAQKAAESEAYAGQGFLSVKRCTVSHEEQQFDEDGEPLAPRTVCDVEETVTPGAVVGELAGKAIGSDIDYIVNAQDFAAYVAAITNAILNRVFAEGIGLLHSAVSSSSGGSGGTPGGNAQAQCAPFLGTAGYSQCINAIQGGQNILVFQQNQLIQIIDEDLPFQNQLLGAKQTTLTILNQSLDTLRQLEICSSSPNPETNRIRADITTITDQVSRIQSDIIALQFVRDQVRNLTDISQVTPLFVQIFGVVRPTETQSLALAAQQETSQRQINLVTFQQQLNICIQEHPPTPPQG